MNLWHPGNITVPDNLVDIFMFDDTIVSTVIVNPISLVVKVHLEITTEVLFLVGLS